MALLLQYRIYREDLIRNRDVLYVFGDNLIRKGLGGQAGEMRGEPNAVGVATKRSPGMGDLDFFAEDAVSLDAQMRVLDEDMKPLFEHVKKGGIVIWPTDGLGTGLSELPKRSPTTAAYLEQKFIALKRVADLYSRGEAVRADAEAAPHL